MKKHYLGSLMMISFLLSSCGAQEITENEALQYMYDIRQKQEEEDFAFPQQYTIEYSLNHKTENTYETSSIVMDEDAKYCYSSKKISNASDDTSYAEKWVYVKENQCIVASIENGISSHQIYTGDLDTLWVTYSNEIRNEAVEMMKGNRYLVLAYYQNNPQIFEDKTLLYDEPTSHYSTKGSGSITISLSRYVMEKVNEEKKIVIGQVTYQIRFADYFLQESVVKGKYSKENKTESIEEKTKVMKKAKLDYPTSSNL